jgi:uncharacterized membrane protein YccF (DUF307 family)
MQTQPIVIPQQNGVGLLVRALYFILFGWWFSGIWAVIAWILCLTIIGLPFGLYMLNRLPQVVTLRPSRSDLVLTTTGRVIERDVPQLPFLFRALYFLLIGWWLSAVWIAIAWALNASIVGMVIGFWMFDRVPQLITLAR